MARRARENAVAVGFAAAGLALLGWLALYGFAWNDYDLEASAAVRALTSGHLVRFAQLAPAYGGSIVLRAPFAFLPKLWGGGELAVYRSLAVPCLLATGALAVALVARMRGESRSRLARAAVLGLCVVNPISYRALELGHPEELLAAVLCVAALLAARRHSLWAGILIGLAIATKTWALVAVPPCVVMLEARRVRAAAVAVLIAAAVLAPLAAANGGGIAQGAGASSSAIFQPWQAWWWIGSHGKVVRGAYGQVKPGYRSAPGWVPGVAHVLVVALAVPLSVLWWRRRRGPPDDGLLLLALLILLRCELDPWNTVYYSLPFLFALLAWEARNRSLPALTLLSTAALWFLFQELPGHVSADAQSAAYLLWALPVTAALAVRVYAPARWAALSARVSRRGRLRGSAAAQPTAAA